MSQKFDIYLIKPTRYDDQGYPLQWWRSLIPSNSLACVKALVDSALAEQCLPLDVTATVHVLDEINTRVEPDRIARDVARRNAQAVVLLVGVQTNQFPRAHDLAVRFRAHDIAVCVGGFHVSGVLAMLKTPTPELQSLLDIGVSLFAGEAEDHRMNAVIADAFAGKLRPIYDHLKDTPGLGGAPLPLLPRTVVDRTFTSYSSFDLGRGCPFECSFCTIINVQGRKSRFRTADDLEAIVRTNAAQGISRFLLTDDNFARNKRWEEFLDRLIVLRKEGFRLQLSVQVDTLAHKLPGFVEKCARAGASQIFIGLENINSDSLAAVKKRQNRVEDFRDMVLAWKKHGVFITCGYIVGFPGDTKASILRDMEVLKSELAIDTIYLNYLTPLPGSADHAAMVRAGTWMDPDLNKYDLNHRVTHHPRMSDREWEDAYFEAYMSFYSWPHMERILKRMCALKSKMRLTTVNRLLGYRLAAKSRGVAFLEGGILRIKRRRQRRSGLPLEPVVTFYPRLAVEMMMGAVEMITTYGRLRWLLWQVERSPDRYTYIDESLVSSGVSRSPLEATRGTAAAVEHRRKVAGVR